MFRSLWFKLVGAFAAVIAVVLLAIVLIVTLGAAHGFDLYVTQSGKAWGERLAPRLADQYAQNGDWGDAQAILLSPWEIQEPQRRQGQGIMGGPGHMSSGIMWETMGFHLVLADADGWVVADTGSRFQGQSLPPDLLAQGTAIISHGEQVGTLLVINPQVENPARRAFLTGISRAIVPAALVAGGLALLMGTLLFLRITSPLRKLQQATQALAAGDLEARVPVSSQDELGQVAQSFNQMAARLDQQQQLRKQMVADIAHELRTPISVMQGTLEAMLDGVLKPEPGELQGLHAETRRLARLVEDLRLLSLADAGQLTLEHSRLNLSALAERVVSRMEPLAQLRNIALRVESDPLPDVEGDPDRLAQVLTNLIDNALRYTQPGGQVTIRLARHDGQVHLTVTDSGPGIPPEELPFVFERFWRGDKSRSRDSGGSGIGLAVVKQLVNLHGGTVNVESQLGKGSVFQVLLPIPPQQRA